MARHGRRAAAWLFGLALVAAAMGIADLAALPYGPWLPAAADRAIAALAPAARWGAARVAQVAAPAAWAADGTPITVGALARQDGHLGLAAPAPPTPPPPPWRSWPRRAVAVPDRIAPRPLALWERAAARAAAAWALAWTGNHPLDALAFTLTAPQARLAGAGWRALGVATPAQAMVYGVAARRAGRGAVVGWPDPPAYVARRRVAVVDVQPGWPPAAATGVLRSPLAPFIGRMATVRCRADLVVWRAGAWHRVSDTLALDVAQAPGGWRVVAWRGPAPAPAAFAWIAAPP